MSTLSRIRKAILVCVFAFAGALGADARAQVVARANGTPITNEQLDRAYEAVLRERKLHVSRMQNPKQARELKRTALDRLITEELFWQQAQKEGLVVSDAEVEKSFLESAARFPTREAFAMQLLRQGTDEAAFRSSIRRLLSADRYAQRVVEQRVAVKPEDVEAFYAANMQLYARPAMLRVRTIAIAVPASHTPEQRLTARLKAESLRLQLAQGGNFDQLARLNSDDPTRQWGGALDASPLADLPAWMQKPLSGMKPSELSAVIETPMGFHLLLLEERVAPTVVPLAQAREGIAEELRSMRGRAAIEAAAVELRGAASIDILIPL